MRKECKIRQIAFLMVSGILLSSTLSHSQKTLTVDPNIQFQVFEGWGTNLAWMAHGIGEWTSEAAKQEIVGLLYDPPESGGWGFNLVRYNIGGGENPNCPWGPSHMTQGGGFSKMDGFKASATAPYDWTQDAGQRDVLEKIRQRDTRGEFIYEANSNSPPWWMTYSQCAAGAAAAGSDNLHWQYYDAFADYLVEVVKHFRDYWNINFRTLAPFNEPQSAYWHQGGGQEGCHFDIATQNILIEKVALKLTQAGLTTTVSASDETNIDVAKANSLGGYSSTAIPYISQINTHSYDGNDRLGCYRAVRALGKRFWQSETDPAMHTWQTVWDSLSMRVAIELSALIRADINEMHASGWIFWQALDGKVGPMWGLVYTPWTDPACTTYVKTVKFYGMGNYSKFIRPGSKIIRVDDNGTVAAYHPVLKTLVLVVTNESASSWLNYTFNLSRFYRIGDSVRSYRTADGQKLSESALATDTNAKAFSDDAIPPYSITTYVIAGVEYGGGPRIDNDSSAIQFAGTWGIDAGENDDQGNVRINDAAGSSATFTFNGTSIRWGGRKGPNYGMAELYLDDMDAKVATVDLYRPGYLAQQILYAASALPQGSHTLKIVAAGVKNSASSGYFVDVDFMETVPRPDSIPRVPVSGISDPFDSAGLRPQWSWVREDPGHWSLSAAPGNLRISTQAGEIWQSLSSALNILLQHADEEDWVMTAKATFSSLPSVNYQQAGLIVYQDDDNYFKLVRCYGDGRTFEFGREVNGTYSKQAVPEDLGLTVWLRIRKAGDNYSAFYSADDITYDQVGNASTASFSFLKRGLIGFNAGTAEGLNVDFDYFKVNDTAGLGTAGEVAGTGLGFALSIHPTPFNPSTAIVIQGFEGAGEIGIYDVGGAKIAHWPLNAPFGATQSIIWRPDRLAGGIYLVRLNGKGRNIQRKCVFLK